MQIYEISQEIRKLEICDEDLYELGYLNGKLDVYQSLLEGLNQQAPCIP